MLLEQTFDQLTTLQFHGMVEALHGFADTAPAPDLGPTDLVGLLADAECTYRDHRKLELRLKQARLRQPACIEDIDYRHPAASPRRSTSPTPTGSRATNTSSSRGRPGSGGASSPARSPTKRAATGTPSPTAASPPLHPIYRLELAR
jgi:IstB-like ATP binding protein